ncbi:hypothetical protein V8F20_005036 [Naviculisporaceae sp. PSN 640]
MTLEMDNKLKLSPAIIAEGNESMLVIDTALRTNQELIAAQQALAATKAELSTTQEDLFQTTDNLIQANNNIRLLQTELNDLRAERHSAVIASNKNKKSKRQLQESKADFQKWLNDNKPPTPLRVKMKLRSPSDKDALIKKLQRELSSKESRLNLQRKQLKDLRSELEKEKELSALLTREGSRLLTAKCDFEKTNNELSFKNRLLKKENRALTRALRDIMGATRDWRRMRKGKTDAYLESDLRVEGLVEGHGEEQVEGQAVEQQIEELVEEQVEELVEELIEELVEECGNDGEDETEAEE